MILNFWKHGTDKEAGETPKSSTEAIENAQTVERCTWFGSAEHIKLLMECIIKYK